MKDGGRDVGTVRSLSRLHQGSKRSDKSKKIECAAKLLIYPRV
jgi:hypothetical protein